MSLVIFAVGNPSRGDDALGPLLMAELETQGWPDVTLVADFQLQIEHALDLDGHDLALFIDAGTETPAPFAFYETAPATAPSISSHALSPAAVLQVHTRLRQATPPAFVLCVRGEKFELGEALSKAAQGHLAAARQHLATCLAAPEASCWRQLQTHAGTPRTQP
ncbi:MAG: hydrogenase maturation protease [Zoogloea sp.]|uniref:hydrogenase maturation protease n=1 Tax=Zoogloea sp. TaxID=49181 RepID=UPI00260DCA08|nr:hydrogenase maturation protease [Zoogloea sp.]MDD2989420.1 hydrogenase maturation protease [Zoogloea sp.]